MAVRRHKPTPYVVRRRPTRKELAGIKHILVFSDPSVHTWDDNGKTADEVRAAVDWIRHASGVRR